MRSRRDGRAIRVLARQETYEDKVSRAAKSANRLEALQAFPEPQAGGSGQQQGCEHTRRHKRLREGGDFGNQLSLLSGYMFAGRVQEDLIVFVTGKQATPDQQTDEYGGGCSPGN